MSIKNDLIKERDYLLKIQSEMDVAKEEYKTVSDLIVKYSEKIIELEKLESDNAHKAKLQEIDEKWKAFQAKVDKKGKIVGWIFDGLKIGVPVAAYIFICIITLNYEKEGVVTTSGGKDVIRKLFTLKF